MSLWAVIPDVTPEEAVMENQKQSVSATINNRHDLVEKVARAMWMADVEPYDPADRIPLEDAMESARAYVYAEADAAIDIVLEEAARVADAMPLSHNAAETALEIAAAIRGMKNSPLP